MPPAEEMPRCYSRRQPCQRRYSQSMSLMYALLRADVRPSFSEEILSRPFYPKTLGRPILHSP